LSFLALILITEIWKISKSYENKTAKGSRPLRAWTISFVYLYDRYSRTAV